MAKYQAASMSFYNDTDQGISARSLLHRMIDRHHPRYGVGTMGPSIYDTAWVSMISKTSDQQTRWLFPSTFQYLLDHQQHDGGWQTSISDIDTILNTLAALLAICRHVNQPYQLDHPPENLAYAQSRATYFLEAMLSRWDADEDCTRIPEREACSLVCKLLHLLQQEGILFDFPGKASLMLRHGQPVSPSGEEALYNSMKADSSIALEGFVGEIDFDRLSQYKVSGSMMASPASTASYLMHSSFWDDESEAYLKHVVNLTDDRCAGGIPSKFPTSVFEITGVVTALLDNGFSREELGVTLLENAAGYLEDCLLLDSGVTGFAPFMGSDADNTAKTISTLHLCGWAAPSDGLMVRYESREYFKTYTQDRSPSFRTNCLVLKALLDSLPCDSIQMCHIDKTVRFLCNFWWTTNGLVEDDSVSDSVVAALTFHPLIRIEYFPTVSYNAADRRFHALDSAVGRRSGTPVG